MFRFYNIQIYPIFGPDCFVTPLPGRGIFVIFYSGKFGLVVILDSHKQIDLVRATCQVGTKLSSEVKFGDFTIRGAKLWNMLSRTQMCIECQNL